MPPFHYLFIKDDGHVFGIQHSPTPEDLDHARVGMATIIRLRDGCYFGAADRWEVMPAGKLTWPEPEVGPAEPFHVPAHF